MRSNAYLSGVALAVLAPLAAVAAGATAAPARLTAEQIVEKHVAAKGGLAAWRAVQTMSFSGKMEAGGKQNPQLPFWMELKRPHKMRVEIEFAHDRALQVFDGTEGWKLRPFLGRKEIEPYSSDQLKSAEMESELDGFLIDYASKGTTLALDGVEKVEGHEAYKLKLTLKGGEVRHLWIDAQTFLEAKIEGVPRRLDGKMRQVEIYYRDFRSVDGLMVPYVLETLVVGYKQSHKIIVEQVSVNPKLDDSRFTKLDMDTTSDAWKHSGASAGPRPDVSKPKPTTRS